MSKPRIGIRPTIDGRWFGVRESLEKQTMNMAKAAAALIEENVFYPDGSPVECVISPSTIGGGAEAAECQGFFDTQNVGATLTVTPCWCYGSETMDLDSRTIKAVWGFNGTERPGAVYLAAVMSAHAKRGLPAFSIYGRDVQDAGDATIPEDVREKLLRFARCATAAMYMRNTSYVGFGSVSMGIAGSDVDALFFQKYLGMRAEWVDMAEILRRIKLEIYDKDELNKAMKWIKSSCKEGFDKNPEDKRRDDAQKNEDWETNVKMLLIFRDIMRGNKKLAGMGWHEEALGRNALAGGFQGQRMWTDWMPNADFPEAILNSSFDWNGKKQPEIFATENDALNGVSMMFGNLLTGTASVFADVRTYWSPDAVKRVCGEELTGKAKNGIIHLINSGAAALDGSGAATVDGKPVIKKWWEMQQKDCDACLNATEWCPADVGYFRGGGYSSHFNTNVEMPVTMMRLNLVAGLGPVLQIAEGYTVVLSEKVHATIEKRTDPTWPTTWFAPNITGKGAFKDVYSVMAKWGANHGSFTYGHIGADLITLASMLRIPVSLHNVDEDKIYRPHTWASFGTYDLESADYRACAMYGALYG